MTFSKLFQVMLSLSVVLALAAPTSAQQTPTSAANSVGLKEFTDRKENLLQLKNVNAWPLKDTVFVVNSICQRMYLVRRNSYLLGKLWWYKHEVRWIKWARNVH